MEILDNTDVAAEPVYGRIVLVLPPAVESGCQPFWQTESQLCLVSETRQYYSNRSARCFNDHSSTV